MSFLELLGAQESGKENTEKAGGETRKAEKKHVEPAAEQKGDLKKQQRSSKVNSGIGQLV